MPGGKRNIRPEDNPKPFKKGDPRINRKGRPKIPDLRETLAEILNDEKDGVNALHAILASLKSTAIKGDVGAARELLDRAYGKSNQNLDITTGGEKIIINLGTGEVDKETK